MKKLCDRLFVYIMCAVFLAFGAAFFLMPKRTFSEAENRTLAEKPPFFVSGILSGDYMSDFGRWYADTFPARDKFVSAKAYLELAQLKCENNGVLPCGNILVSLPDENDYKTLESNLSAVSGFASDIGERIILCAIPRTVDVCAELLPPFYPTQKDAELWEEYESLAHGYSLDICDVRDVLSHGDYYKTDHHYTTDGAYKVYKRLGGILGYTPYDDFEKNEVSGGFCGTSMRASGFYLFEKDKISLYRYDGDETYTVICDGGECPLYDFTAIDKTDKYALFLGGNHARVDISSGGGREKILLIRDSFADSLAPFLARHFDLTLVDLRYYKESMHGLFSEGGYSSVLVLESITELEKNSGFGYLYR